MRNSILVDGAFSPAPGGCADAGGVKLTCAQVRNTRRRGIFRIGARSNITVRVHFDPSAVATAVVNKFGVVAGQFRRHESAAR